MRIFYQNQFTFSSWGNCPGNQSIKFFVEVDTNRTEANKAVFSGYLEVEREIKGPLDLSIEVNRCDNAMKKCEKHPTTKLDGLCHKLNNKKAFYYGTLANIQPPLECPLKAQRYVATNATFDFTAISFLPLSGYIWLTTLKVSSGEGKVHKLELCILMEVKIVRVDGRKKH